MASYIRNLLKPRKDPSLDLNTTPCEPRGQIFPQELLLGTSDHPDLSFDPDVAWSRLKLKQAFLPMPSADERRRSIRVVCISDTHGLHRGLAHN